MSRQFWACQCWNCGTKFEQGDGYGDPDGPVGQVFCSEDCSDEYRAGLGA